METAERIADLRLSVERARRQGKRIGFVPTMGALHAGHFSLIETARRHADIIVVSIFVNPIQFNSPHDLETYPRTWEADLAGCRENNVDLVFAPTVQDIYPPTSKTAVPCRITAGSLAQGLCGATRPGHFDGVVTVVGLLFNLVMPDVAVFGEKDYQQLRVIKQMVDDLHFPVEIVPSPIIREPDGLAMSSRNVRLNSEMRARALCISQTLFEAVRLVERGEREALKLRSIVKQAFDERGGLRADYIEIADIDTLEPIDQIEDRAQLLAAVFVDDVRLIDNVRLIAR